MIDINLLYPKKQKGSFYAYGLAGDLIKDLNMSVIFHAMADQDEFIYSTCRTVMMNPICDEETLRFRQQMVNDAVRSQDFYEEAYRLATRASQDIEKNKGKGKQGSQNASKIQQIYNSLQLLLVEVQHLGRMKDHMWGATSQRTDGMEDFTKKLREFYSDEFAETLKEELEKMAVLLRGGRIVMTAGVGAGMKCSDAVINRIEPFDYRELGKIRRMLRWLIIWFFSPEAIRLKDTALKQEASQMETNGLHYMLQVFQKVIHEFEDFIEQFRYQISFYVGCARLHRKLSNLQMEVCTPQISREPGKLDYHNLYELSMALTTLKHPVPNTIVDECRLHIISGANQGGKSTFLRSVGIAQVMMQAGLFVPATYFTSSLYDTILTHFTRREDSSMNSGRLVEEMKRMNRIVDMISSRSLILMNESFSSTTEKEGSQIAGSIIQAMYDSGVTIWMVTHLFAFARKMYEKGQEGSRSMSAERLEDGTRTYKIIDHEPMETSYGLDLYEEIVEKAAETEETVSV